MAKMQIIVAKLPALIADRTDSLKLETAIRYVDDIIFDASQNRRGEKAIWLAGILADASSPVDAQSREAIFSLFRDGYLDRYAEYSAWRDIASVAGISPNPTRKDSFSLEADAVGTPKVLVLTRMLNAATASPRASADQGGRIESAGILAPSTPTLSQNQRPAAERLRESKESVSGVSPHVTAGVKLPDQTEGATVSLEIGPLESSDRNPIEFAAKIKKNSDDNLSRTTLPCLIGFAPKISTDSRSVEWTNPITAESFRDYGDRLTSGSTGRLGIRAMLELARAENWTKVAVKGKVRLQAFTEATAAELDRPVSEIPGRTNSDRTLNQMPRPSSVIPKSGNSSYGSRSEEKTLQYSPRPHRSGVLSGLSIAVVVLLLLTGSGFGAIYVYQNPELQRVLHLTQLVSRLPWKQKLVLPAHELDIRSINVQTCDVQGNPRFSLKTGTVTDTEMRTAKHLSWIADLTNNFAGIADRGQRMEARLYGPDRREITSNSAEHVVSADQPTTLFSGILTFPESEDALPGLYRIVFYADNRDVSYYDFTLIEDPAVAKAKVDAAEALRTAERAKQEREVQLEQQREAAIVEQQREAAIVESRRNMDAVVREREAQQNQWLLNQQRSREIAQEERKQQEKDLRQEQMRQQEAQTEAIARQQQLQQQQQAQADQQAQHLQEESVINSGISMVPYLSNLIPRNR
jgi:hypothetical protein